MRFLFDGLGLLRDANVGRYRPLVGALIVANKPRERTQWVYLFIAVQIVIPGLVFLRETKQSVLESRAASVHDHSSVEDLKPQNVKHQILPAFKSISGFLRKSLFRPLHMLFTEPIVTPVCLYAGFNFGLIYALIVVFPDIFANTYSFDTIDQGLSFLGLIAGCIIGPIYLILDNELLIRQTNHPQSSKHSIPSPSPETRLRGAKLGSLALPLGLFWFAWTANPSIPSLSPIFASALITFGALTVYVSTSALHHRRLWTEIWGFG